jgi:glycosyltransferase involved in cell wall biosynthesis
MDVLIDTVARLSDIDLDLVVIGDGSMRETWEQYAEQRGLADRVFFIGRQSHEATLSYMAAADVFALASVWESFSIVILEAMSVHTPVVVSDIRGPDEIITDGEDGFLITPEDSAAFADTIERLLSSPELISRVVENAEETLSEYRVSGVADRVLSLFGELSESSKP